MRIASSILLVNGHHKKMKTSFTILLAGFLFVDAAFAAATSSPRDITNGDVRVVLMSVSQTMVFPNPVDNVRQTPRGHGQESIPCFTITVLVEALGDKPFSATRSLNVQIFSAGKQLTWTNSPGVYHQAFGYDAFQDFLDFTRPKVSNPKRAFIMRYAEFGAVPITQPLDLVIKTGFDENIQEFQFKSVSVK
jgi:hypothetical protein